MSDFLNRLKKNSKHLQSWAKREGHTVFRLFDSDLPQWPVAVDWYNGQVHVSEYFSRRQRDEATQQRLRATLVNDIVNALSVSPEKVHCKSHQPHAWGETQYQRLAAGAVLVQVEESKLHFECNVSDFLDTGLFLDHRMTRQLIRGLCKGKRFLNLFSYTGSFTVYAAAGGALQSTSVDLSQSYCQWAQRNLKLNGFSEATAHRVVCDDVMAFLTNHREQYDLIVVDPPTFSASKKMTRRFEVQRDHRALIEASMRRLAPGGSLFFSTNYQPFVLDQTFVGAEELTEKLRPKDFRTRLHRCWRLDGLV